mgnify:CR=1 FL=1
MKANNDGKAAEFLARLYLRCKGYHIIAANVITGKGTNAGEIDIIARRRKLIIFAEVKKRRTIEKAAYAISARQKESDAAPRLLSHGTRNMPVFNFDLTPF